MLEVQARHPGRCNLPQSVSGENQRRNHSQGASGENPRQNHSQRVIGEKTNEVKQHGYEDSEKYIEATMRSQSSAQSSTRGETMKRTEKSKEFCGYDPSAGKKISWMMAFLQNSALELCLQFVHHLSRQVSLYSSARRFHLQHFDFKSEEFLDKVPDESITARGLPETFAFETNSMCPVAGFGRGSTQLEDLERLSAEERERIFPLSTLYLAIRKNHS